MSDNQNDVFQISGIQPSDFETVADVFAFSSVFTMTLGSNGIGGEWCRFSMWHEYNTTKHADFILLAPSAWYQHVQADADANGFVGEYFAGDNAFVYSKNGEWKLNDET